MNGRFSIDCIALAAAMMMLGSVPAAADAITDLVGDLPAQVSGLSRIPGPDGETTSFVIVREADRDRLFIQTSGAETPATEVRDAGDPLPGRVTDLRSERDALGIAVFVDFSLPGGDISTYELFWEGDDASTYVFRPASN